MEAEDPASDDPEGIHETVNDKKGEDHNDKKTPDNDDPFIDAGSHQSTVKVRRTRASSDLVARPPPMFTVSSPSPSSVKSEAAIASSAPSMRLDIFDSNYGPGPAVESTDSLVVPVRHVLPLITAARTSTCTGPDCEVNKTDDPCYACILANAKENKTFQQDEAAAEKRLHEEIERQTQSSHRFGHTDRRRNTGQETTAQANQRPRPTYVHPTFRGNAADLGRGNPY